MRALSRAILFSSVAALGPLGLPGRLPGAAEGLSAEERTRLRDLYQKARALSLAEDYTAANQVYRQLLESLPRPDGKVDRDRRQVHYDMAVNFARLDDRQGALESLRQATACGFWDADRLKRDRTFRSYWSDLAFAEVIASIERGFGSMPFGLERVEDGRPLEAREFAGKVLVIDVWGTWCPPCRQEIPHFIQLQQRYGRRGLQVIGMNYEQSPVSVSLRERVRAFNERHGINYPCVLIPPEMRADIPGLRGFPTTYFVDHTGRVRAKLHGLQSYAALEEKALRLLEERERLAGEGKTPRRSS